MTRFAMGTNISRLSAPLYPALENILHQMMTAKTIETNPIIPTTAQNLPLRRLIGLWLFGPCNCSLLVMIFI